MRRVRPVRHPAFLSLAFAPGEAAQVDWGSAGIIQLGATRRRLSFFVMVLCHSRMAYVEFTCGEAMEHFLACHHNALEYFRRHARGDPHRQPQDRGAQPPVRRTSRSSIPATSTSPPTTASSPAPATCAKPTKKAASKTCVGYVKKNFLAGLDLPHSLSAINTAARQWLDTIANVRVHERNPQTTRRTLRHRKARPASAAARARRHLRHPHSSASPTAAASCWTPTATPCPPSTPRSDSPSRPSPTASASITPTTSSPPIRRCYERHRDFEDPDHVKELLDQRRRARDAKWLLTFYALSPHAEYYHQQLQARSLNARIHINKIVALTDIYGPEKVALAIDDAIECQAFSSQYIENILQQRERHTPHPAPSTSPAAPTCSTSNSPPPTSPSTTQP